MKKIGFLLVLLLVLGGAFWAFFSDQNNIKMVHTQSGSSYIKTVLDLKGTKRHDLLKAHSQETLKVADYHFIKEHTKEQTVDYFTDSGWTEEATTDAILWNIFKAYAVLATSNGATEEEIFNFLKGEKPACDKDCMQVLIEEIAVEHE